MMEMALLGSPYIRRHPWYPQGRSMFRRSRLHAPTAARMSGLGAGYTHGVFDPVTPYAFPSYAPVHTGLDGYAGFGADAPLSSAPGCGISELANYAVGLLPQGVSIKVPIAGYVTLSLAPVYSYAKSVLYDYINANLNSLAQAADSGASYLAGVVSKQVSTPIVKQLFATSLPPAIKALGASAVTQLLDNELRKQFYKLGAKIRECLGKVPDNAQAASRAAVLTGAFTTQQPCLEYGLIPQQIPAGQWAAGKWFCVEPEAKPLSVAPLPPPANIATHYERGVKDVAWREAGLPVYLKAQEEYYDEGGAVPAPATGAGAVPLLAGAALVALLVLR